MYYLCIMGNRYIKKEKSKVIDGHKLCSKCNEILPVGNFRENLKIKSGLHSYCVDCCIIPKKVREPKIVIPKIKGVKPPRIVDGECICRTCQLTLPVDDFYKYKSGTVKIDCKKCVLEGQKKNREINPKHGRYREYQKEWRKNKRDESKVIREEKKLILQQEKEKELELLKIQKENIRLENLENKRLEKIRITEEKRLERIRIKEEYLKSDEYKEYQILQKEKQRLSSLRKMNRRMENPLYRFQQRLRNNIKNSFRRGGFSKTSECRKILGADWDVVKSHFESKFTDGMSWDNQGLWHIDHIIPKSLAKTEEDIIRLNHYTNLQPLWGKDNLDKSDKILDEHKYLLDEYLLNDK